MMIGSNELLVYYRKSKQIPKNSFLTQMMKLGLIVNPAAAGSDGGEECQNVKN